MAVKEQTKQMPASRRSRTAALVLGAVALVLGAFGAGAAWMSQPAPASAPAPVASAPAVQIVTLHGFVRVRGWLSAPGSLSGYGPQDSCMAWRAPVGEGSRVTVSDVYGQSRQLALGPGRYQGLFPGNTFADPCIFYFEQTLAAGAQYHVQVGPYQQWVTVDAADDYPQVDIMVE